MLTPDQLKHKAMGFLDYKMNWDSYNAEPPNRLAYQNLCKVLNVMTQKGMTASGVIPDVEGGLALMFVSGIRFVEWFFNNTGEVHVVCFSSGAESETKMWTVTPFLCDGSFETKLNVKSSLDKIADYIVVG